MRVDDEDLADRAYAALLTLHNERQSVVQGIERCVVANLERMGAMGQTLVEHVRLYHPEFPFKEGLGEEGDAWDHLPTLSPRLQAFDRKGQKMIGRSLPWPLRVALHNAQAEKSRANTHASTTASLNRWHSTGKHSAGRSLKAHSKSSSIVSHAMKSVPKRLKS